MFLKKFGTKKDMNFFLKIKFTIVSNYTFIYFKILVLDMYLLVFNFQYMVDMHKRYAYQISKYIV
jgi:uncharacterized membrane protein YfhO